MRLDLLSPTPQRDVSVLAALQRCQQVASQSRLWHGDSAESGDREGRCDDREESNSVTI